MPSMTLDSTRSLRTLPTVALLGALLLLGGLVLLAPAAAQASDAGSWDRVVAPYGEIRNALLHDTTDGVKGAAQRLQKALDALAGDLTAATAGVPQGELATVRELLPGMRSQAAALAAAGDLDAAREAFEELSRPLVRWHGLRGGDDTLAVTYCPMAKASWLQPASEPIGNPYHGQSMATCGRFVESR